MSYQEKLREPIAVPGVAHVGLTPSSTGKPLVATTVRKTLTSAQLLALHTTTVVVVPKAGSGTIVLAKQAVIEYDYAATAYSTTAAGVYAMKYTNENGATVTATVGSVGFIDQSSDQVRTMPVLSTSITPVENADIVLYFANASNPTTGDGTLAVTVEYSIVKLVNS